MSAAITSTKTEAIIIGAGPTGLMLACQLVRYGVDFIIIDKKDGVTPFSKALGVHARTLEIYEQMGLAQKAIAEGTVAGKVRLLAGAHVRGEMDLSSIGRGLSPYPYLLVLEQSRNERLLYDYLLEHGKDVQWQAELSGFSQTSDVTAAQVMTADGDSFTIEAKYLVGCDGPKSPVRHGLGLGFEGSTFERIFYVADVQIDWQFSHDALHICLARSSGMVFFPMPGERRYRIVGAFPEGFNSDEGEKGEALYEKVLYEKIELQIRQQSGLDLDISHVSWFSTYKVHTRHVERFSSGRCFLAGDAAHVHTPAGGQGMNTGIQDAYNLAWKLAFVLRGKADSELLDSYNHERLENAKHLVKTTDRMFNLVSGSGWLLRFMRTVVIPPLARHILTLQAVRHRFFPLLSQIGINYRSSPISHHDGDGKFAVKAGDRMPWFMVDGASVYDRLHAADYHLLVFSDENSMPGTRMDIGSQAMPLTAEARRVFGTDRPFAVLLRPDNYIARITHDISPDRIKDLQLTGLITTGSTQ
jgi:2-polyprenyl-6-methoxyphenol hydroxylase-like FAD-dependent oxidoreductase